jgi:ectoine hydroxylase-related dioxygenase (phytanoyl-CoA dioxygenase family)
MAAPAPVSPRERAFFEAHGWLVVRGVLDSARVGALAEACERLMPQVVPGGPVGGAAAVGIPQCVRPSAVDAAFRAWLAYPKAWQIAAALFGDAVSGVQLLQDALLVKPAGASATLAWHRDRSYLGYVEPERTISVRLAISACTEASGCMWVLDGSHGWAGASAALAPEHPRTGAFAQVADGLEPEAHARLATARVPILLAPGDVSFHDGRTLHASFANTSREARQTLVAHVCPGGARLVPERLAPHLVPYFPSTPEGLLAPEVFPYVPLTS